MKQVKCVETGQVFDSITAAANWLGVSQQGISSVLRRKQNTCGGYHWKYIDELTKEAKTGKERPRKRRVQNLDTGRVFDCIKDAADFYGIHQQNISTCARGKVGKAGGYRWAYATDEDEHEIVIEPAKNTPGPKRRVKNLDSGRVFASIADAAEYYGLDARCIGHCASGKSSYCGGFRWAYADDEPVSPIIRPKSRPTMTVREVLEEAKRQTEKTGRKVTYADIQIKETIQMLKAQEAAEKKRRAKRCKTKSA